MKLEGVIICRVPVSESHCLVYFYGATDGDQKKHICFNGHNLSFFVLLSF